MSDTRIPLGALSPEGLELHLDDQALWTGPLAEFGMDCRITSPISADISIQPLENGYLIRGKISGDVMVPCNRCAEPMPVHLEEKFEDFEDTPAEETEPDGESRIIEEKGALYLDVAAIVWEQFVLALPPNPLCRPDCKGLCPECGANLNEGMCACSRDEGDPRMAVLRGLKIRKQ